MNTEQIKETTRNIQLSNIYLGISESCNAACTFCYREFYDPKPCGFMSREVFSSVMEQVRNIKTVKSISLTVGEPVLHPRFDEFSAELNREKTYRTTLVTNMSLAHKHMDAMMLYDGIVMSIEGHDKPTYEACRINLSYDRVRKNVIMLREKIRQRKALRQPYPSVKINFIVNRRSEIRKFVEAWQEYTDLIMIDPMLPQTYWGSGSSELRLTDEHLFSFSESTEICCLEPFYRIGIMSDGAIKPCGTRMLDPTDYGSYTDILDAFYHNKNIIALRKFKEKNGLRGCLNCRHALAVNPEEWQELIDNHRDLLNNDKVVFAKGLMEINSGIWKKRHTPAPEE